MAFGCFTLEQTLATGLGDRRQPDLRLSLEDLKASLATVSHFRHNFNHGRWPPFRIKSSIISSRVHSTRTELRNVSPRDEINVVWTILNEVKMKKVDRRFFIQNHPGRNRSNSSHSNSLLGLEGERNSDSCAN